MRPAPILQHFDYNPAWILFEDDDLIIANKPSGLLSVPGRGEEKRHCFLQVLSDHHGTLEVVHRLDMDTSGIMVYAKHKESLRHLSRQFQDKLTQKTYLARVSGILNENFGKICLPLRCDWERRPLQMICFNHGKYAETHYQVIQQTPTNALVQLTPITGRSHQLRLHMKYLGHPILGDNLYADPISLKQSERLCLHAHSLGLTHPRTGESLFFSQDIEF